METLKFAVSQGEETIGEGLWQQETVDAPDSEWQALISSDHLKENYWDMAVMLLENFDLWYNIEKLGQYCEKSDNKRFARILNNAKRTRDIELKSCFDFFSLTCLSLGFESPQLDDLLELAEESEHFSKFADQVYQKQDSQAPAEPLLNLI